MQWNKHLSFEGKHALLSPSKYSWINDSDDEFMQRLCNSYLATMGTLIHKEARDFIFYKRPMTKNERRYMEVRLMSQGIPEAVFEVVDFEKIFSNVCNYVKDAVSFRMDPEVVLFYSELCFGTSDAILYDEKKRILRVHDLKTGFTPAKMDQLYVYAALFFLEYSYVKMSDTKIELRIYQNNEVVIDEPGIDIILPIMETIKRFNNIAAKETK
jgi:hypothetical protein